MAKDRFKVFISGLLKVFCGFSEMHWLSGLLYGGPMAWKSLLDNLHDLSLCSSSFRLGLRTVLCVRCFVLSKVGTIRDVAQYKFVIDVDVSNIACRCVCPFHSMQCDIGLVLLQIFGQCS